MLKGASLLREMLAGSSAAVETVHERRERTGYPNVDAITEELAMELASAVDCSEPNITVTGETYVNAGVEAESGADLELRIHLESPEKGRDKMPVSSTLLSPVRLDAYPTAKQRLPAACTRMLDNSPAAFVLVYTNEGMKAISAASIDRAAESEDGLGPKPLVQFYYRDLLFLLRDFYRGYVGDRNLEPRFGPPADTVSEGHVRYLVDFTITRESTGTGGEEGTSGAQLSLDEF